MYLLGGHWLLVALYIELRYIRSFWLMQRYITLCTPETRVQQSADQQYLQAPGRINQLET